MDRVIKKPSLKIFQIMFGGYIVLGLLLPLLGMRRAVLLSMGWGGFVVLFTIIMRRWLVHLGSVVVDGKAVMEIAETSWRFGRFHPRSFDGVFVPLREMKWAYATIQIGQGVLKVAVLFDTFKFVVRCGELPVEEFVMEMAKQATGLTAVPDDPEGLLEVFQLQRYVGRLRNILKPFGLLKIRASLEVEISEKE